MVPNAYILEDDRQMNAFNIQQSAYQTSKKQLEAILQMFPAENNACNPSACNNILPAI